MVRDRDERREIGFAIPQCRFGLIDPLDEFPDLLQQGFRAVHGNRRELIPVGIGILILRCRCDEVIDESSKEGLLASLFFPMEIDAPIGGIGKSADAFGDSIAGISVRDSIARVVEARELVFRRDRQWTKRGDSAFHEKDF